MTLPTDRLIEQLAASARPVRPLASPLRRTLAWLALATLVIALLVSAFGPRRDLLAAMSQPALALEWLGSLLTGLLAAYAAFQISVPGRSLRWAWLPLPALLLWLGGVGLGCFADWSRMGAAAFAMNLADWHCAREILVASLPLGLAMLIMVRHAGVVRPGPTALLGGLAAAAMSAAGVSLFHPGETALMVLLFHLGTVALLSLACLLLHRPLFAWVGFRPG